MRLAVVAAYVLLLSACAESNPGSSTGSSVESRTEPTGSASIEATPTPSVTSTSPPSADPDDREGTRVIVEDSDFGPMLYAEDGQAIYLFDLESTSAPRCYDECAEAWPPVLTEDDPLAGQGVDAGLIGTTRRTDGGIQLTYAGHPLYFYAHEDPWQVLCHDFTDFGGTWYVVQPDGDPAP